MKVLKKFATTILVAAMGMSLVACGKSAKKITSKEFKKALKSDYAVQENENDDCEEEYIAVNEDGTIMIIYDLFESKSDAKAFWQDGYDTIDEALDDEEFDGDLEKKGNKITAKGTFEDNDYFDGDAYIVVIRAEEMVITAYAQDTSKSTIKEVDKAIESLGF